MKAQNGSGDSARSNGGYLKSRNLAVSQLALPEVRYFLETLSHRSQTEEHLKTADKIDRKALLGWFAALLRISPHGS